MDCANGYVFVFFRPQSAMHNLEDITRLPDDFDGRVRLFPLPELVVFPHAMQPLHIFEPRYCEMLSDALASDELIAMATLTDGIATAAQDHPPISPTVCIGRIISHAEVEDDRHNVLLVGTQRATIIRELNVSRPFRIAQVNVTQDVYPPMGAARRMDTKRELLTAFGKVIPASSGTQQSLQELMAGQMGLGPITDIISYTLPFAIKSKLALLSESNVDARAIQLVELLQSGAVNLESFSVQQPADQESGNERFPPPFSVN